MGFSIQITKPDGTIENISNLTKDQFEAILSAGMGQQKTQTQTAPQAVQPVVAPQQVEVLPPSPQIPYWQQQMLLQQQAAMQPYGYDNPLIGMANNPAKAIAGIAIAGVAGLALGALGAAFFCSLSKGE